MGTNKSFSTETSERYSRALYEVAKEDNETDRIQNDVINFQKLINSSPEIKNFIQNPTQSIATHNSVVDVISKKIEFFKKFKKNFFYYLLKKEEFSLLKKF